MSSIDRFTFDVTPWAYSGGEGQKEWRVHVVVDDRRYSYTQIMPDIPWNQSELEVYLRCALEEYGKVTTNDGN